MRLLPSKDITFVFELKIPAAIAHLRDVLGNICQFCNGNQDDWTKGQFSEYENLNTKRVKLLFTEKKDLMDLHVDRSFAS